MSTMRYLSPSTLFAAAGLGRGIMALALALALAAAPRAQGPGEPGRLSAPPPATDNLDDSYAALRATLEDMAAQMDWGKGQVSLCVADADVPGEVLAVNAALPLEPGSALQLVTAAAALDTLGPDFKFHTELLASGAVEKGRLAGSLIVRGGGDPTISQRYGKGRKAAWAVFDEWARALKQHGIRQVEKGVYGDASLFDDDWMGPGWPDELRGMPALPSVSALNFNHNCFEIDWFSGGGIGFPARYEIFPNVEGCVYFSSTVRMSDSGMARRKYSRVEKGNLISAAGEVPRGTNPVDFAAIEDPARFFAGALKMRLNERGVKVSGDAVSSARPGASPGERGVLIAAHDSPPLTDILRFMLTNDSALEAETVLKMMGARSSSGGKGSFEQGCGVVADWLGGLRQAPLRHVLLDGAGRSPINRISAEELVNTQRAMRQGKLAAAYEGLLPRAGEGILQDRLGGNAKSGGHWRGIWPFHSKAEAFVPQIWAVASEGNQPAAPSDNAAPGTDAANTKQDTNRSALAGRARTSNGRTLAFAFLVSNSTAPQATLRDQLDRLALALTH